MKQLVFGLSLIGTRGQGEDEDVASCDDACPVDTEGLEATRHWGQDD